MRTLLILSGAALVNLAFTALVFCQKEIVPARTSLLHGLARNLRQSHQVEIQEAESAAVAAGILLRCALSDGRIVQLQRTDDHQFIYYITNNLNAARTVGTDQVWPDGVLGLTLTGSGQFIGLWDEGSVLTRHREMTARVEHMDDAVYNSDHATHVAGTLAAAGIMSAARGMAYGSSLLSYDWNNDQAEVAEAAAAGLTLSNHSYSIITGWQLDFPHTGWNWWGNLDVSSVEDFRFGFYDSTAYYWDLIAAEAPDIVTVVSAGNDRADTGPTPGGEHWVWSGSQWISSHETRTSDGDYDCLPGGAQVAKNVLVVGAVEDLPEGYTTSADVVMTPFSSWGPTDDGRIKPDVVANGWQLYSTLTTSDSAYGYMDGTSMAAATVTGSLALLRQYYLDTHDNVSPSAASLRALAIHCADEAGVSAGPDYSYGWGLLNTAAAARLIGQDSEDQRILREIILSNGASNTTAIEISGSEELKITITWTDPPGCVFTPQVDLETSVLVNDLDLRLIRESDALVFCPWRLNTADPDGPATTGDNSVDNVEQVVIPSPAAGKYLVEVTHKSALLAGAQDYTIIITGASFPNLPAVLVWEGDSTKDDYSGTFIRNALSQFESAAISYTTSFPGNLEDYAVVFLSFGPSGALVNRTFLDNGKAEAIQTYLEAGGALYLEGGDILGVDQAHNDTLMALLGISSVGAGQLNPIDGLYGQDSTLTQGMVFNESTQLNNEYPDKYFPDSGVAAFTESGYGTVAVQYSGLYGQRTFTFSYALEELVDATLPSTRAELVATLFEFFMAEPPPAPNQSPIAVDDSVLTEEDMPAAIYILRNDYDPDGDQVVLASVTQADYGSVNKEPGDTMVTFLPEPDFYGQDSFSYAILDGQGGADTGRVWITVMAINDAPLAVNDTVVCSEDIPVTISVLKNDTDIDGDPLDIIFVTPGALGSTLIDPGDSTITYCPDKDVCGIDSFSYIISDRFGGLDSAEVVVMVTPINDTVIAEDDSACTTEDTPVILPVLANDYDVDGDSLIILAVGSPCYGDVTLNPDGMITYMPQLNYFGLDSFQYHITDGMAGCDSATVHLEVLPVNDPPQAVSDTLSVKEDSSAILTVLANDQDPEGDRVYLTGIIVQPSHGEVSVSELDTLSLDAMVLRYCPDMNFFGQDNFHYSITDGELTDTANVMVDVMPVNDAPAPFLLQEPETDTTVVVIGTMEERDSLMFSWEPSWDVEGDAIHYIMEVSDSLSFLGFELDTQVTRISLADLDLAAQWESLNVSGPIRGSWDILATDGMDTTASANGPRWLVVDVSGLEIDREPGLPLTYALYQNYPNPFNPDTYLKIALPSPDKVRVVIIDLLGREVTTLVDGVLPAGYHLVAWDGTTLAGEQVPSGVYFAVMESHQGVKPMKMILLR
ncbi:MAG: tandem-95 repeat protein [Fidelibacterota bacterium]|nr:MAG: tandem-95 repeat protein [Candidatus Neomarinimicrobiota bacterium]